MRAIFRENFERDLKKLKGNAQLLARLQQVVEQVETAEDFDAVTNVKPMQGGVATTAFALATTGLA